MEINVPITILTLTAIGGAKIIDKLRFPTFKYPRNRVSQLIDEVFMEI